MERGVLPFNQIHLFPSQLLIEGDGAGIEPAEGLAPQPREAREQRLLGWGGNSKKAFQVLSLRRGEAAPDLRGRGGAGGLGILRWNDSDEGSSLRLRLRLRHDSDEGNRGHGCSDPSGRGR